MPTMREDQASDQTEPRDRAGKTPRPSRHSLPIFGQEDAGAPEVEAASLADAVEGEPRTVLITGACGNIGMKLRRAWTDVYDLVLIDKAAVDDDPEVFFADLSVLDDDWITHFHGVDTVVHLAANSDEFAPLDALIGPNLDAMANVFHASALAGVERVIFASSNHVMGEYQQLGEGPITPHMTPLPDGPYAMTKLVGERMGQSLARAFDLTVIALRLGWIQEGKNHPETLPHDWARKMWLSNADLIHLFDCAVEAMIEDRAFVVLNGMSRNHGMRWDLSETAELLGFLPKDDAFAVSHRSVL
jgi:nucleoside-diphosphate-sugar epimerase